MSDLPSLITRRGHLKAQITRLATYLRDNAENHDVEQIQLRLKKTKGNLERFSKSPNANR